jgi:hypothetical protein
MILLFARQGKNDVKKLVLQLIMRYFFCPTTVGLNDRYSLYNTKVNTSSNTIGSK